MKKMDMPHSECESENLTASIDDLNKKVRYYSMSGYYSPNYRELAAIKLLYEDLSLRILKMKTKPHLISDIKILYQAYCRVRLMLSDSVFKEVRSEKSLSTNAQFNLIHTSYLACVDALKNMIISDEELVKTHEPDFFDRNVLVGSLRNRDQLDICLKHRFYHIPARNLPMDISRAKYIAIYQSKNFYARNAGIRYYGRVVGSQLVKRCDISEIPSSSTTDYYKFTVESWQTLPDVIISSGGGAAFAVTSLYQLLRARDICELHFTDQNEYKLYCSIRNALSKGMNRVACRYKNLTFGIEDSVISVYKNKKRIVSVSSKNYLANPGYYFWKMMKSGGE